MKEIIITMAAKKKLKNRIACNISNMRKSVSSDYPNTEKCVEKRGRVFLTTSRCLDILMKHSSECLI